MAVGLYSGVSGLALGIGLYKNVSGLWGGSSGLINGFGGSGPFPGASLYLDFLTPPLDPRITFTRGSNATRVDATGKITYAPANLFTYSEFPNGVTDAPTRAGLLTATTFSGLTGTTGLAFGYDGSTSTFAYKSGAVTGITYSISVYVRMDDGDAPVFGSATGSTSANTFVLIVAGAIANPTTYAVMDMGGGLYRVSGTFASGGVPANSGVLKYATNNNRTFKVSGYQLEPVTYQTTPSTYVATTASAYYGPRFDYDPVTLAPKGLLIEEARTNLALYSEQFDNAFWIKAQATVTANAIASPDGTVNADKLVETAVTNVHAVYNFSIAVSAGSYTTTGFFKAAERTWTKVTLFDSTGDKGAWFNLSNGTVGTQEAGVTATIFNFGNGWYRCSVTRTLLAGSGGVAFYAATADNVNNYAGVAGSGIFIYGAQLEAGSFATSYIPTVASTVTRSADVATMTGTNFSSWYNQSEGAFVVSTSYLNAASTSLVVTAHSGTPGLTNDYISYVKTAAGINRQSIVTAGVAQGNLEFAGVVAGTVYKMAGAYKLNDVAFSVNGATALTDTTVTLPTPNALAIGFLFTSYLNGHIRQIAYYNTRLPNAQLQTLTAPSLATTLTMSFTDQAYTVGV